MSEQAKRLIEEKIRMRRFFRAMFHDHTGKLTTESAEALRVLKRFCYGDKTTARVHPKSGMIDPVAMGKAEGMRIVFLMFEEMLNTDDSAFERQLNEFYQQQENDQ